MARLVTISSVCYGNKPKEVAAGRDAVRDIWDGLIDLAAADEPDIILLPEHFFYRGLAEGYGGPWKAAEMAEEAKKGGYVVDFLSRKAAEHRCYIFGHFYRKDEKDRFPYNTAVLLDRRGEVAGYYDKVFPTLGAMDGGQLPGAGPKTFDTDFGRIAAGCCFDFNFRELFVEYRRRGVELFCFLSAYAAGRHVCTVAREYQMFVASSVPGGGAMIVNPLGEILEGSNVHRMVMTGTVNLDSRVFHIDGNIRKMAGLKMKYGRQVKIEVASPEAWYLISSEHPEKTIADMAREFELEYLDDYLERARAERRKRLPDPDGSWMGAQ